MRARTLLAATLLGSALCARAVETVSVHFDPGINPAIAGDTIPIVAHLTASASAPTGFVTFLDFNGLAVPGCAAVPLQPIASSPPQSIATSTTVAT